MTQTILNFMDWTETWILFVGTGSKSPVSFIVNIETKDNISVNAPLAVQYAWQYVS